MEINKGCQTRSRNVSITHQNNAQQKCLVSQFYHKSKNSSEDLRYRAEKNQKHDRMKEKFQICFVYCRVFALMSYLGLSGATSEKKINLHFFIKRCGILRNHDQISGLLALKKVTVDEILSIIDNLQFYFQIEICIFFTLSFEHMAL